MVYDEAATIRETSGCAKTCEERTINKGYGLYIFGYNDLLYILLMHLFCSHIHTRAGQLRFMKVYSGQLKSRYVGPSVRRPSVHWPVGPYYGIDEATDETKPQIDPACGGY